MPNEPNDPIAIMFDFIVNTLEEIRLQKEQDLISTYPQSKPLLLDFIEKSTNEVNEILNILNTNRNTYMQTAQKPNLNAEFIEWNNELIKRYSKSISLYESLLTEIKEMKKYALSL